MGSPFERELFQLGRAWQEQQALERNLRLVEQATRFATIAEDEQRAREVESHFLLETAARLQSDIDARERATYLALSSTLEAAALSYQREAGGALRDALQAMAIQDAGRTHVLMQALAADWAFNTSAILSFARENEEIRQLRSQQDLFRESALAVVGQNVLNLDGRAPSQLLVLPPLELYSSSRAIAVVSGVSSDELEAASNGDLERVLDTLTDDVEHRLGNIDQGLLEAYRGARHALDGRGPDWRRHFATSTRELIHHLLHRLAPESDLAAHYSTASEWHTETGEISRKAQLRFIFRHVAVDGFERVAEQDIEITLATFYPANGLIHTLVAPLDEHQVRVLWRRAQGCIAVILEANSYD